MATPRSMRPSSSVRLDCNVVQISFPEVQPCPLDLDDVLLMIRRSGGCPTDWELAYPPFGRDRAGNVAFRLDSKIHQLPAGYYDAVLTVDCEPCATVRLDKTKRFPLRVGKPDVATYSECPPPSGALPGEGHSTVYDQYFGWTAKTTCRIEADTQIIKLDKDLPTPLPDTPPQLVIRDGVATEIVTVVAAQEGQIVVKRDPAGFQFPQGACIQFEWTSQNVKAVANEDCPVVEPSDPDDSGTDTTTSVLKAGKGLQLKTNDAGEIEIALATTGVVGGEYGGLQVDECGRVVKVDAIFPAAPAFDGCCDHKDEADES